MATPDHAQQVANRPADTRDTVDAIGARIRTLRYARRMTQANLAHGRFSVSYISALERGVLRPSLQALEQFAAVLRVPVASLLTDTPARQPARRPATGSAAETTFWQVVTARVALAQGHPAAALLLLDELPIEALEPDMRIEIFRLTAECHLLLGNNEWARLRAAKGVSVAEREYLLEAKAHLLVLEARAYDRLACPEVAMELLERALDAFTASPYQQPVAELDATLLAYALAHRLDQFQRAEDLLERAQRLATALGTPPRLAALDLAQAHEALVTGDWTAAGRFLRDAEATLAHEQACAQQARVAEMLANLRMAEIPATGSGVAGTAVNLAHAE